MVSNFLHALLIICVCRKMKNLDDDVYSFGYIILESIVGPSVSAKKESFMLNDMVSTSLFSS